jgi:hypothetical protein
MCDAHISTHQNEYSITSHVYKPLYKTIDPSSKSTLLNFIQKTLEILKESEMLIMGSLTNAFNEIRQTSQKAHSIYSKIKTRCFQLTKDILEGNKLVLKNINNYESNHSATCEDLFSDLFSFNNGFPRGSFSFKFKGLNPFKRLSSVMTSSTPLPENPELTLYYFQENTKNLVKFNCETLKPSIIPYSFSEPIGSSQSMCLTSPTSLFLSGGYYSANKSVTARSYLINTLTKFLSFLPRSRPRSNAMAICTQGCVFIFGGFDGKSAIQDSDCFDLIKNSWISISPMPVPLRDTSTVELDNDILISGREDRLVIYSPCRDTYNVLLQLPIAHFNLLVRDGDYVYLLTSSIWRSNFRSRSSWQERKSAFVFGNTTSRPVYHNSKAYFVDWRGIVYSFSFSSCHFQELSRLS